MRIIVSADSTVISKSLASLRECPSQEIVRSTTQRQGSFSHAWGLIFSVMSTPNPNCSSTEYAG